MSPIIRRPTPPLVPPKPMLPASFLQAGFVPPSQARIRGKSRFRGLMLATEGRADTGKTEFVMSAPGPGAILACDRGFDAVFDNAAPPVSRRSDFGIKTLQMPKATDFQQPKDYIPFYANFFQSLAATLDLPEARTVCVDGDNYTWDLQRLAEWGRLSGIWPQTKYADPIAARMSLYHRMWDSGKIIICTNMMQDEWRDKLKADGTPMVDKDGNALREKTGDSVALGFPRQEYLWQVRIRHLYKAPIIQKVLGKAVMVPAKWGLRITKAKSNPALMGTELWGDDCTFAGLVQTVYPHVPLEEWGL